MFSFLKNKFKHLLPQRFDINSDGSLNWNEDGQYRLSGRERVEILYEGKWIDITMKNLYLIRGVSGAGKTTFAKSICDKVVSADDYFLSPSGDYNFNASKLKEAHTWCHRTVAHTMRVTGMDLCVANTFTEEWEMEAYYDLADKYGYRVFSIIVENRHGSTSVHDVPEKTIEKQTKRFDIKL